MALFRHHFFLLALLFIYANSFASEHQLYAFENETHTITNSDNVIILSHGFIDKESVRVTINDYQLTAGDDYRISAREGIIRFVSKVASPGKPIEVKINYSFQPMPITRYSELHPVRNRPQLTPNSELASKTDSEDETANNESGELDVNGSKSVRISSGNRREMTVDQTLRLSISGMLTEDIKVNAALSDNNLPVVPEGTTEELREIDKVLVEVQAPFWSSSLGDFVAEQKGIRFGGYRRKLQGVMVNVGDDSKVSVMAGSPKGSFQTFQIRGQESNQGPYYLSAGQSGEHLYIVAGSERVTLDGESLVRGQDRDYIIDYVRGSITFTYKRLITADSEIVVEYEEGQGKFAKTVSGVTASKEVSSLGMTGVIGVSLVKEQDDQDRLISGELSESDIEILAQAGDSELLAVNGEFEELQPGEGDYIINPVGGVDTWLWDAELGNYNPHFYHVGMGLGDYSIDSLTVSGEVVYGYRGPGNGNYYAGKSLTMPKQQQLASISAEISAGDTGQISAEWNSSDLDANTFSSIGDADNSGTAIYAKAKTGEIGLHAGLLSLGRAKFSGYYKNREAEFTSFLNSDKLFDYVRWGLGQRATDPLFLAEKDIESSASALWRIGNNNSGASLSATKEQLEHGETLSAQRTDLSLSTQHNGVKWQGNLQNADALDRLDLLDVTRKKQTHSLIVSKGPVEPELLWTKSEDVDSAAPDSLAAGYRIEKWQFGLKSSPRYNSNLSLSFERGLADSLYAGQWNRERDSRTSKLAFTSSSIIGMRVSSDGTLRKVLVPGGKDMYTRLFRGTMSADWKKTRSNWSLTYAIDNSRTEVLDRQVVFVGQREGDYNQNGDFVGFHLGDFNVVTVGTDSLVATTEVSADFLWRQSFDFLGKDNFYGAWSTTTHLNATSRSLTDDMAKLLSFHSETLFDPEKSVLGDVNWRQDFALLKNLKRWDLRLQHEFAKRLDKQYATHPEQRLRRHQRAILSCNISAVSTVKLSSDFTSDNRITSESSYSSNRSYDTFTSDQSIEWLWRPGGGNNFSLEIDYLTREDEISDISQTEYGFEPKARFRLASNWSGLLEFRYAAVDSEEPAGSVRPYFFPIDGNNNESRIRLAWNPASNLAITLSHFGRKRGDRGWQHDFRMESTARF